MFTVTPIGSCRITGPLRHGQDHHGIALNLGRCYGYCHSPAEAVQLARFMQGAVNIPEDIWPLVSPSRSRAGFAGEAHRPSDLYVIELASAKELTVDGVSVQLNYLSSAHRAFFADAARAQAFWGLAEAGDADRMAAFLERVWSADDSQRAEAATLARIRLTHVTRESLARDIARLADMLPQVMFVTHVDAKKPDGAPIASRRAFIEMVNEEVSEAGLPCFDPTVLMHAFGQTAAIEDHSTSLAHFTEGFTAAIMDEWLAGVIAPLTDAAVRRGRAGSAALERQIRAAQAKGAHADVCTRLERLKAETDAVAPLLDEAEKQRAAAQAELAGEIAGAALSQMAPDEAGQLVERAAAVGLFETAADLAETPGSITAPVLMTAARRAAEAGAREPAFILARQALQAAPGLDMARTLVAEIAASGPVAGFAELSGEEIREIVGLFPLDEALDALETQGVALTTLIEPGTSQGELADMVSHLFEQQRLNEAAEMMAAWRGATGADRLRATDLVAMLDAWVEAAGELDKPMNRLDNLTKIEVADPNHKGLKLALKAHKEDLASRIRTAGKAGDEAALTALEAEVALFPAEMPEYDLWRARLRFKAKDYAGAITFGQKAADYLPATLSVWVLLMRAAVRSARDTEAAEFARAVLALTCEATEKFRDEAEAVLSDERVSA